jgi:hypothetical protein
MITLPFLSVAGALTGTFAAPEAFFAGQRKQHPTVQLLLCIRIFSVFRQKFPPDILEALTRVC